VAQRTALENERRALESRGHAEKLDVYRSNRTWGAWWRNEHDSAAWDAAWDWFRREYGPRIEALQTRINDLNGQLQRLSPLTDAQFNAWLGGTSVQRDRLAVQMSSTQIGSLRERLRGLPPHPNRDSALAHIEELRFAPSIRGLRYADSLSPAERAAEWERWHNEQLEIDAQAVLRREFLAQDPANARRLEDLVEDGWTDALDQLPASMHAAFRRDFQVVAHLSRAPDGTINYELRAVPTEATRRIQMQQALAIGMNYVSYGPEYRGLQRRQPFLRPVTPVDALALYGELGTEVPTVQHYNTGGGGLQATNDEMLFIPAGSIMRAGVGLRAVLPFARAATTEIATNLAFHVVLTGASAVGEHVAGREGRIGAPVAVVVAILARGRIAAARASASEQAAVRQELETLALQRETLAREVAESVAASRLTAAEATQATRVQTALRQEAQALRQAATQVTRANVNNARHLVEASQGRAWHYPNPTGAPRAPSIGHARDHIPLRGQDARVLAQSRPDAALTTTFQAEAEGLRALRDVMRRHQARIDALQPGQILESSMPGIGPFRLPTPVRGFNSVRGAPATTVQIEEVTFAIGRLPNGELQLIHFSPRVPR